MLRSRPVWAYRSTGSPCYPSHPVDTGRSRFVAITRLEHGGVLYRSPNDAWIWIDRWTEAPNYADAYRSAEKVSVVALTHCHFDHVGEDCADLVELASVAGATTIGSHETSVWLPTRGIEAVGMNKGGTFEAAGIGFGMVTPTTLAAPRWAAAASR